MRIVMVSQFYAPILGGEEQCVRALSMELAARGHDVAVATQWLDGHPAFEIDHGVRVYRLRGTMQRLDGLFSEANRRHAPPFPDPELVAGLGGVLRRERPQIVHAHNWLGYQLLPLKSLTHAKLVVSLHDMSLICAKKSYMYADAPCTGPGVVKCFECATRHYGAAKGAVTTVGSWLMNQAERHMVDMFLPVSQATAVANGLVGSRSPYEVMPNFVPDNLGQTSDDVEPYLAQLPSEEYLLYVGGLRRIKGIDILLRAYAQLQNPPPLVLVGYQAVDTPTSFPPGVTVVKNWPHAAAVAAWRRSILGLVPSVCLETFGLVVLEAMVAGRPVIASRIGGLTDLVVDGTTGLLVTPGDPEALRDAIQRLLASPELRERMGQRAKEHVLHFRASSIVPRVEQLYWRLIHGGDEQRPVALAHAASPLTGLTVNGASAMNGAGATNDASATVVAVVDERPEARLTCDGGH